MKLQFSSYLRASNIYAALSVLIFAGALAYGIFQFQDLRAKSQAMKDNSIRLEQLDQALKIATADYKTFGQQRAKKTDELAKKISSILPPDENYTDLTRLLDNYFSEHDTAGNPIFQASLRFGKGEPVANFPDISALPVSMNIDGTRDNFFKFLDFVKNSGTLESGTRFMEVNSIQLNFTDGGEVVKDLKQNLNFTLDMNAYYQTPKVSR
ncbi:MAG: hypothetical protein AAB588_04155 [Patescibacteria group bacterium]